MGLEEYNHEKCLLYDEYQEKVFLLKLRFAEENNPCKVGDVVTDHQTTIRVEKWELASGSGNVPYLLYTGVVLTKSGSESKRQKSNYIYQSNIRTINGKEYAFRY